jgi:parvulin-like peptidyl-prolyl isomerase
MRALLLAFAGLTVVAACGGPQASQTTTAPLAPSAVSPSPVRADETNEPLGPSSTLTGIAGPPSASARPVPGGAKTHVAPAQISARHILIQWMGAQQAEPSVVRTRDQAMRVAEDVLRRARSGEDFARLAVEFSDEPGAGHRGGSLGRFGHGQMVKEFEDAVFALEPGEISGIVESPFGFHIIQRTE